MSLTKEEFLKKLDQEDPKLDPACGGAAGGDINERNISADAPYYA